MFDSLEISELFFDMAFEKPVDGFKFFESTLRGGFGHVFRRVACGLRNQNDCKSCMLFGKCVYSLIFDSPVPDSAEIMTKYPYCPHPFVFAFHTNGDQVHSGKSIKLILIGKGTDHIPYFVYSLHELGQIGLGKNRVKFHINSVCDSLGTVLYDNGKWLNKKDVCRLHEHDLLREISDKSSEKLSINLLSPCRVKLDGHLTDSLDFHVLIRNLLRRLSALSYFHCDQYVDLDYRSLIILAEKVKTTRSELNWVDKKRYSTRQKRSMMMGGVTGTISYEGNIKPFLPILLWGEKVHVGKGTSFGFGQYSISYTGGNNE